MTVKMMIAADRDNAIGWQDGRLPWKIPADLKRFKELTIQSTVLMGRKTFESLKRPEGLPERNNLVLSRTLKRNDKVPIINAPLKDVVDAHQDCLGCEPDDLWIIGGAAIYDQAIKQQLVDEIYLTFVDINSGADVKLSFNLVSWDDFMVAQSKVGVEWYLTSLDDHITHDGIVYKFLTLKRHK